MGVFTLRLSDEQFWNLTPAQFWALHDRFLESVEQSDYRAGVIASQVYNVHCARGKAREPFDYFPGHRRRANEREANRQATPNEVKLRQRIASAKFAKLSKAKKGLNSGG